MSLYDEIEILVTKVTDDKLTQYRLEEEILTQALRSRKLNLEMKTMFIKRIKHINKLL
jgi:hypothetical protein